MGTDFRALFEAVPTPFLVLNPDAGFAISAVSDSYLRATLTTREGLVGRGLFEVFPDNPDDPGATGERNLRASLHRVLATRAPDRMPPQQYDIPRPGGGFEERHWLPLNTPVLAPDGAVVAILHHVEDVTEAVRLRREGVEQKLVEAALRESGEWFSTTLNSIGDAVIATDPSGRVTFLNGVAEELTGRPAAEARGRPLEEVFVIVNEATRARVANPAERVLASGKVQGLADRTVLIAKDGRERPIDDSAAPIKDDRGRVTGVVLVFRDVTERRRDADEMLRLREEERAADGRALRILESITDAFFSLDREWRFTYLNPQAEATLGIRREDLLGANVWEVYPGLVGSEFEREYRRVAEDGAARSITAHYPDHDRWYEVHAYPAPGGLAVYFRDASERMRAEADRERLAALADRERRIFHAALSNTPDLIYVFDLDHRFIYANEALLGVWGRTLEDAIGKDCRDLGYEPWHAELHGREIDQVVATRRPIRGEVPFTGTNGRRIYDYIFTPVIGADGTVQAVAGTTRDVTERKRSEEELKEGDRRKDEFLAMLAHELRNPLSAISNAVQLARQTGLREHVAWSMEVIDRQMRHLTRLIDDLLDVSRISRGKIELRKAVVDATAILDGAAATVQALLDEREHTLELAIDRGNLWVDADPTRLEQVVVNLLNNAAKYSEDAGRIRLEARNEPGAVVIVVEDRGVGIAPEKLPGMFELFAQGDRSLARSEGGLGIGLTVVKRLVELHGGSVTAASEGPGRGSRFTVRLPAAGPAPRVQPAAGRREAGAVRTVRILVVDDNEDTTRLMARLLKLIGHEVVTAYSGPEAIEVARALRPEFILLDIGLPGMNGYEVAIALRREAWCQDTTIVAVSGYGRDEDRRRSKEAGFDHHFIKPLDHDALRNLLAER